MAAAAAGDTGGSGGSGIHRIFSSSSLLLDSSDVITKEFNPEDGGSGGTLPLSTKT